MSPTPNGLTDALEALDEAKDQLQTLAKESSQLIRLHEQPSPGLLDAIKRQEKKVNELMDTVTLWRVFLKECPNHDTK